MLLTFLSSIIASITSVEYYRHALGSSFWVSLRFYLVFLAAIACILTAEYWLKTAPTLRQSVESIALETSANYPSNLIITWKGNSLSSNSEELSISFPTVTPHYFKELSTELAVINPSEDQTSRNALFEVTPTKLYMLDQGQRSTGVKLSDVLGSDEITLNQASLHTYIGHIKASVNSVITLVGYIYPIWAWFGLVFSRAYILVIEGSLIFILMKLQQWKMQYIKVLQLCLHIFIPAEIINQTTRLAGITTPISMLMLSFWVLFVVIFFSSQQLSSIKKN